MKLECKQKSERLEKVSLRGKISHTLGLNYELILLLVIAVSWFSYMYWVDETRPGIDGLMGWLTWADQGEITREAKSLAAFTLPDGASYPLGYPLLGAIFFWAYPHHFFIPNLIMLTVSIALYFYVAKKFLSTNLAFFSMIILMAGTQFTRYFLIPWSHWVPAFSLAVMMYFLFVKEKLTKLQLALVGFFWGFTFSARTAETLVLLPVIILIIYREILQNTSKKEILHKATYLFIPAILLFSLVIYSNSIIQGRTFWTRGYEVLVPGTIYKAIDLWSLSKVPETLYSFVINPRTTYDLGEPLWDLNEPLLWHSFFFIFAPVGVVLLYNGKYRLPIIAVCTSVIISFIGYMGSDIVTSLSLKYITLREFLIWFPFFTISSVYALDKLLNFKSNEEAANRKILYSLVIIILLIVSIPVLQQFGQFQVPKRFLIGVQQANYSLGETVDVYAQILDINGKPIFGEKIYGRYELEGKIEGGLEFVSVSNGFYYSSFPVNKPGKYKITLFSPAFGGTTPESPVPEVNIFVE